MVVLKSQFSLLSFSCIFIPSQLLPRMFPVVPNLGAQPQGAVGWVFPREPWQQLLLWIPSEAPPVDSSVSEKFIFIFIKL